MFHPMDTKTFNNALSLKLKELHEVFNAQTDILNKNEVAHENAMTAMYNQLMAKEEALRVSDADNKNLKIQLGLKTAEIATLNEKISTSNAELSSLNDIFNETSRHASGTSNRLNHSERRIENMRIELASYLTRLTEMKKKLRDAETEMICYREMYCRLNKSYQKSSEDLNGMIEKFETRSKLQDEFIKTLMETLKLHGIYDFENDEITHEIQPTVDQDSEETSSDVDGDFDSKPPLKNYPNWRPSSKLTTILEVDETEEDDDEEEEEEIERIDSAIESDFQAQSSAIDDDLVSIETPPMSSSLISIPAKQEEVIIQVENCEIVDSGNSTDDMTTGSSVSVIHSGDSVAEVDAGEDGKKAWKKTKKRQKKDKKKASQSVEAVKVESKPKLKRRYSKMLTTGGWF